MLLGRTKADLGQFVVSAAAALHAPDELPGLFDDNWIVQRKDTFQADIQGVLYLEVGFDTAWGRNQGMSLPIKASLKLLTQNAQKAGSPWAGMALQGHQVTQVWYIDHLDGRRLWGVVVNGTWYPNAKAEEVWKALTKEG